MKSKQPKRGPARMKELGRTPVTIYLDKRELEILDEVRMSQPRASVVHAGFLVWAVSKIRENEPLDRRTRAG